MLVQQKKSIACPYLKHSLQLSASFMGVALQDLRTRPLASLFLDKRNRLEKKKFLRGGAFACATGYINGGGGGFFISLTNGYV